MNMMKTTIITVIKTGVIVVDVAVLEIPLTGSAVTTLQTGSGVCWSCYGWLAKLTVTTRDSARVIPLLPFFTSVAKRRA